MQRHVLNREESCDIYEDMKEEIEKKQCYTNVFKTIVMHSYRFNNGEWKIAYGYIRVLPDQNMMARHCFIVNEKNEAIDPTMFVITNAEDKDGKDDYFSFKIFDSLDEYLDMVARNDKLPDLMKPLMKIDHEVADKWADENGYFLIR